MNAPSKPGFATLKVTQVGNSLGVVLPREVLAELDVEKGDKLYLTKSPEEQLAQHGGGVGLRDQG